MKALGILLLAVGVGFLAYFYAYPPIADALGVTKPPPPPPEEPKPTLVQAELPPPPPPVEVMPEPPKPEPPKPPPPKPVVTPDLGQSVRKPDADGFIAPEIPSLETLTQNWTTLPAAVFREPKQIKISKPVEFTMNIGGNIVGSNKAAGSDVFAIAAEGTQLIVVPSVGSNARASVALGDTNLKEVLNTIYERYKVNYVANVKKAWLRNKTAMADPAATPQPGSAAGPMGKPAKNADGTYDILLSSMKAGQVTEVTPQNITRWEEPQQESSDGKEYWTIVVAYTTKTMFGDFPTAAKAWLINDKVEKWLYRDSGEVIP